MLFVPLVHETFHPDLDPAAPFPRSLGTRFPFPPFLVGGVAEGREVLWPPQPVKRLFPPSAALAPDLRAMWRVSCLALASVSSWLLLCPSASRIIV